MKKTAIEHSIQANLPDYSNPQHSGLIIYRNGSGLEEVAQEIADSRPTWSTLGIDTQSDEETLSRYKELIGSSYESKILEKKGETTQTISLTDSLNLVVDSYEDSTFITLKDSSLPRYFQTIEMVELSETNENGNILHGLVTVYETEETINLEISNAAKELPQIIQKLYQEKVETAKQKVSKSISTKDPKYVIFLGDESQIPFHVDAKMVNGNRVANAISQLKPNSLLNYMFTINPLGFEGGYNYLYDAQTFDQWFCCEPSRFKKDKQAAPYVRIGRIPFSNPDDIRQYFTRMIPNQTQAKVLVPLSTYLHQKDIAFWKKERHSSKRKLVNQLRDDIPYQVIETKDEFNQELQSSGLVEFCAHGQPDCFSFEGEIEYSGKDIPDLSSNNPIIIGSSCSTARQLGKDFLQHGAAAFIGPIRPYVGRKIHEGSLGYMVIQSGKSIAEKNHTYGLTVLGDPSIHIKILPEIDYGF